ncbi:MAG TPA: tetratricopeptide repeat protein [Chitinophagaceae bacterium]|nr:tetratricopeptide repeat protein [Chitinophagaceae bacterium]
MKKLFLILPLIGALLFCACGGGKKQALQPVSGPYADPAIRAISTQIDAQPGDAALFFKRAKAFRALGADSVALIDLKQAVQLDSSKANYFSAIGELLFEHKDIDGSVLWFTKAIRIDPKDPVAHLKFARILVFMNDNQKAFNEVNTVLRRDPYNAEAYFLKGVVYKNLDDTAKAMSSFQTSVQVDPGYQPSILQLALLYAAQKDTIALQYFDNAYAADTTQLMPWYGKAMFYQDKGDYEKAKKVYSMCLRKDPTYTDAYFNTGWILMHQDSLEKAVSQFSEVLKLETANFNAYYNRGLCYELLKRKEEAKADYKSALQYNEDYQEPKNGLKRLSK